MFGIYYGDPALPTSRIISFVFYDRDVCEYVSVEKSSHGRGGMISKLKTAQDVANAGIKKKNRNLKKSASLVIDIAAFRI